MPIRVLLFASLRSRFGPEFVVSRLVPPIPVSSLREALAEEGVWTTGARIAVNQRFTQDDTTIQEGDEVAVIPPVSGG